MSPLTAKHAEPISSSEIPISDPQRIGDIGQKHQVVAEFLESHRYDALLLEKPVNFSWFTAGGDCSRGGSTETTAALFITPEARVVVATGADSSELFDRDLFGLGFQLKERPWHEPRPALLHDLCRGRTVASDSGFNRTHNVSAQLSALRIPLTALECERSRELGHRLAHAVEATARNCRRGQTEAEIAGELSHRLIKRRIVPQRIQVLADEKAQRYPHWSYGDDCVERFCTMAAVGRLGGLCVGAARTVSFGEPPRKLRDTHLRALLVQATGMFFSQPDWELFEIWNRVRRIYDKFGCNDQWQRTDLAEIMGYETCEVPIVPKSEFRLSPRMAVHWHPSIGPAVLGDTILVGEEGFELLTPMERWPRMMIQVKGQSIFRPGILCRS